MEISLLALIGISIGAMFFGYFFGLFEGRGQGYKKRRSEEGPGQEAQETSAQQAASTRRSFLELGRDEGGQPLLHVDGRRVDGSNVTSEQRRRLIDLMVMLRPWVDPGAAPPPSAGRMPAPEFSGTSMVDRSDARPSRIQERIAAQTTALGGTTQPPAPPPSSMSLVAQINLILQARLAGTPLADRGIRLAEALHGGAIVFIGTAQYDEVDKVPDPEVQAAIRAAIAEWEKNYAPR